MKWKKREQANEANIVVDGSEVQEKRRERKFCKE